MIEDGGFRRFGYPDEFGELLMLEFRVALGDVPRSCRRGIPQLVARIEMPAKLRAMQEQLDAQVHLMREFPGSDIGDVFERGHAADSCNRVARRVSAKSGLLADRRRDRIEEFATFEIRR